MRKLALIAAFFSVAAFAQTRGNMSGIHAPAAHPSFAQPSHPGFRVSVGRFGRFQGRESRNFGSFYSWPYYSDFYPQYNDSSYEEPPPAPAPVPARVAIEPISSPALLELQGNQWVKVNSFTMPAATNSSGVAAAPIRLKEIPPAVLVFRDGHTEELTSYSIIDGAIHAKSDYWTNGSWTRTIQIADLDLPATLKQNQERGVKFDLPSGPNEVIIRP